MNILCVGGIKDGNRIDISDQRFKARTFCCVDKQPIRAKLDDLGSLELAQHWYHIIELVEDGNSFYVAVEAGKGIKCIEALINGYKQLTP